MADLDAVAPTPAHADFLRVVDAAVTARRADESYPAPELAEIVRATRRRANGRMASSFTRDLQALALAADLDLEPPVNSRIRFASGIKSGVGKVVGFYVRHLGTQVTSLGVAVHRLGVTTATEIERLDAELAAVRAELAHLRDEQAGPPLR